MQDYFFHAYKYFLLSPSSGINNGMHACKLKSINIRHAHESPGITNICLIMHEYMWQLEKGLKDVGPLLGVKIFGLILEGVKIC